VSTERVYISRDVLFNENYFPLNPSIQIVLVFVHNYLLTYSSNEGVHINHNVPIIPITKPLHIVEK
jgi:hypothetical protein